MKDNKLTFEDWVKENYDTWTESELEQSYDEMLNEITDTIQIGCIKFDASYVLAKLDPIAYNVGFGDYSSEFTDLGDFYVNDEQDEDELRELYNEYLEEE